MFLFYISPNDAMDVNDRYASVLRDALCCIGMGAYVYRLTPTCLQYVLSLVFTLAIPFRPQFELFTSFLLVSIMVDLLMRFGALLGSF
jgi:hypothetical protein